jgi:hypothetical protein
MRTCIITLVLVILGCGGSPATGGAGGNGGSGNGVGGTMTCVSKGSPLDCNRACADLDDICKDPSQKLCLEVCAQIQSYCASFCKLAASDEDYALFGCLQASNDCPTFAECGAACVTRSNPMPIHPADMTARD